MIQSGQETNFTSHLFSQMLKQLKIKHNCTSAYHRQSQGALEFFRLTVKLQLQSNFTFTNNFGAPPCNQGSATE